MFKSKKTQYYIIFSSLIVILIISIFFSLNTIEKNSDDLDYLEALMSNYADNIDYVVVESISSNESLNTNIIDFDEWFYNNSIKNNIYFGYFLFFNNFFENNIILINHLKSDVNGTIFCYGYDNFDQNFYIDDDNHIKINNTNAHNCTANISFFKSKIIYIQNINASYNDYVIIYYLYDPDKQEIIIKEMS